MIGWAIGIASKVKGRVDAVRLRRRWERLRSLGMRIGQGVNLPMSTWIDADHCFLISIGDWCGFGEECAILAHDAQMDEFLDAGRIGRVIIHAHSHIGARSVILPGVEIGPRTIVGANSTVTKTLPPDTVWAGNPATLICTLEQYLQRHQSRMRARPCFEYGLYDIRVLTPERRAALVAAVADDDAYMVGGHSAMLDGAGGTMATGFAPGSFKR